MPDTTDVVVEEQDFAESKAAAANYSGGYQQNSYQGAQAPAPEPQPTMTSRPAPSEAVSDGFMTIPEGIEEELPFI